MGSTRSPDAESLHGFLDRWEMWASFGARMKLSLSIGDSTLKARGHILYMIGERYEVGFSKPYDRFLGNLYVSPDRFVYWHSNANPEVFGPADTIRLSELMQTDIPNWNPRDLLPFPVAGRTGGFQVDSLWRVGGSLQVQGHSSDANYTITVTDRSGTVTGERVERSGYDPVIKEYGRFKSYNGWPIARRVVCKDTAGTLALAWQVSGIVLDAESNHPARLSDSTHYLGTPHE